MNTYSYKLNGQKPKFIQKHSLKKSPIALLKIIPTQISLRTTFWSNKIKDFPALNTMALLILASLNS
jgi:hypothetical protein